MSRILVDTSIWIDYFEDKDSYTIIDKLVIDNLICTNDLILAELVPFFHLQEKDELVEALMALQKYEIRIDWPQLIHMQISNLKHGINGVGVPDLIILENVLANDLILFTKDKHFMLMKDVFDFKMFDYKEVKRR